MGVTIKKLTDALLDLKEIVDSCDDNTCMCGGCSPEGCGDHSFTPQLRYNYSNWEKYHQELLNKIGGLPSDN